MTLAFAMISIGFMGVAIALDWSPSVTVYDDNGNVFR